MVARYEGYYAEFQTAGKDAGGVLMGADSIVGDACTIDIRTEEGVTTAWILNKFGAELGFFAPDITRRIQLALGRGYTVVALLASVSYASSPEPGRYWGEAALICMDAALGETLAPYVGFVSEKLAEGMRPQIELSEPEVNNLLANPGWHPPAPPASTSSQPGSVTLKSRRTITEALVEQGRKRNPGCYVVSIAFIVAVVAGIVLLVRSFLG